MRTRIKKVSTLLVLTLACVVAGLLFLFPTFSGKKVTTVSAATGDVTVSSSGAYQLFNSGCSSYSPSASNSNPTLTNNNTNLYFSYSSFRQGPIGIPFEMDGTITERSSVTINAYDVDESSGEIDGVYLNDLTTGTQTRIGQLVGQDSKWSTTNIQLSPDLFQNGHRYRFSLRVEVSGWVVYVKSVNFNAGKVEGGVNTPDIVDPIKEASISASINSSRNVTATLNVATMEEAKNFNVEFTARHVATNNQLGSLNATISATTSGSSISKTFQLESGSPAGNYEITAVIKDTNGNVLKIVACNAGYSYRTVSYNANGGSNNCPIDNSSYNSGSIVTVLFDYIPSKAGYIFLGWATDRYATTPTYTASGNKTFTMGSSDVTLYAVWQCDHNFVETTMVKPTCTTNGIQYFECSACGKEQKMPIYAKGHVWEEVEVENPTCTQDGYKVYVCDVCEGAKKEVLSSKGHNWGPNAEYTQPTCTHDGYWLTTCLVCEVNSRVEDYGSQLGHAYGEGVVTLEPTCVTDGVMEYICTECQHIHEEVIPSKNAHDVAWKIVENATCEKTGLKVGACAACEEEISEEIPAFGHTYTYTDNGDGATHNVYCETCDTHKVENHNRLKTCVCGYVNPYYLAVLLIQDSTPWNVEGNAQVLDSLVADGHIDGWEKCSTTEFAKLDPMQYSAIVFANDQTNATYANYSAIKPILEKYVQEGGVLVFGACWHGWRGGELTDTLLGDVGTSLDFDYTNAIVDTAHPIVTGSLSGSASLVDNDLKSTYASHIYFTNVPQNANVIFRNEAGEATLLEYAFGEGNVIASGLTWEYSLEHCSYSYFADKAMDDMVLYALSVSKNLPTERKCTVTYKDFDGEVLQVERVLPGENAVAELIPEREGYTFLGWDISLNNITENVTATAQYAANTYVVTTVVDATKGSVVGGGEYEMDETVILTATANKGYVFLGWYMNGKLVCENTDFVYTVTAKDVTVEGRFVEEIPENSAVITVEGKVVGVGDTFEVSVILSNNIGLRSLMAYIDYDSTVLTLIDVRDSGLLGKAVHSTDLTANPYMIAWNNENATENFTENGVIVVLVFKVLIPDGYTTHIGVKDFTMTDVNNNKLPCAGVGGYTDILPKHEVNFETNGGTQMNGQLVLEGGKLNQDVQPEKYGYHFGGWYKDADFTQPWDFEEDVVDGDTTLYAKWVVIYITIVFECGDIVVSDQTVAFDSKIAYVVPEKDEYTFNGWYLDKDLTQRWEENHVITSYDLTLVIKLYPSWSHKAEYHVFGQQIVEDEYLASEATCTSPARYYAICTCGAVGETTFEVGEGMGHRYHSEVIAPTETEQGYTLHTCETCQESYKDNFVDYNDGFGGNGGSNHGGTNNGSSSSTGGCGSVIDGASYLMTLLSVGGVVLLRKKGRKE